MRIEFWFLHEKAAAWSSALQWIPRRGEIVALPGDRRGVVVSVEYDYRRTYGTTPGIVVVTLESQP